MPSATEQYTTPPAALFDRSSHSTIVSIGFSSQIPVLAATNCLFPLFQTCAHCPRGSWALFGCQSIQTLKITAKTFNEPPRRSDEELLTLRAKCGMSFATTKAVSRNLRWQLRLQKLLIAISALFARLYIAFGRSDRVALLAAFRAAYGFDSSQTLANGTKQSAQCALVAVEKTCVPISRKTAIKMTLEVDQTDAERQQGV